MTRALVWFRRDLRCHDHAALYHALRNHTEVYCGVVVGKHYPQPIVDHAAARDETRTRFSAIRP